MAQLPTGCDHVGSFLHPKYLLQAREQKASIGEAALYAPLEQLALSPQCGFSSTVHGDNIAVEAQRATLRLVVEAAREARGG